MLRNWLTTPDVYTFKTAGFKELAGKTNVPFLALGDDTEKDPEVLSEFAAAHPKDKTVGLYIHRVTGRKIPDGLTPFYSAFDVALAEFEAGRLNHDQLVRVGQTILGGNLDDLFPSFTLCPETIAYADTPKVSQSPDLMQLKQSVANLINDYCLVRNGHAPKKIKINVVPVSQVNNPPCPGTINVTPAVKSVIDHFNEELRQKLLDSVEEL
jgi:hypothetical protein